MDERSIQAIESIIDGRLHVFHGGRWLPVPSGGADGDETPPDDEQPPEGAEGEQPEGEGEPEQAARPEVPEDLTETDEDALRALHAELDEYRVAARERQDVDEVRAALADQARIVEELNRRKAEKQRKLQELAELDEAEVPALPEAEPAQAGAGATAAQLAAIRSRQSPAAAQAPPPPMQARPRVALQASAGAGADVVRAGTPMTDEVLGQAIERVKRQRGDGQVILASIPAFEEMDEGSIPTLLSANNPTSLNDDLINEAVADWHTAVDGAPPIQASARLGALCGPFDIIREIPDAFVTSTPVADMFPSRPAGRGGFTFTVSGTLADVAGASNLWSLHGTNNDQDNVDPNNSATWKPCITFDCPPNQEAFLEAIVTCVEYPFTLEMSAPERVQNLNNAVNSARARLFEGRVLQKIDSLSHAYHFNSDYGALPSFVDAVNRLLPSLNYWNRQEPGRYDMILPPGCVELLRIDRANRAYGVEMEVADVMAYLLGNIDIRRVVLSLDASLSGEPGTPSAALNQIGSQPGTHVPDLDGVHRVRIIDPAAAIYADTGEVNAGVLRDASMIKQNRTGYFTESMFFLEKHGPQPWATIDLDLCPNGARAGLVDPYNCAVQS